MAHDIKKPKRSPNTVLTVVWRRIEALRPDGVNLRSHSPQRIRQLARSIDTFGFNVPILVDPTLRIIAGHGRLLAARELGWREVPTILLAHLSEAKARAFMIADNRLAEGAAWNNALLLKQLAEVSGAEPDGAVEATGFELGTNDPKLTPGPRGARKRGRRPVATVAWPGSRPIARIGEWWLLDRHRVGCGNLADEVGEMLATETSIVVVLAAGPASADAVIRRWQASTGGTARHAVTGAGFKQPAIEPDAG